MKVEEIRAKLREWPMEDVLKLYSLTYRRLPKEVKEEMDALILAGPGTKPEKKVKKEVLKDMDELEDIILEFVENAKDGKYYYSNREVSKKERSNWRFTVKAFIKDLLAYPVESEYIHRSNMLLIKLYGILSRACTVYTFASQDPFHTLGYESQSEFLALVAQRVMAAPQDESISELIKVGCNGSKDYMTVDKDCHNVLLDAFQEDFPHVMELAMVVWEPVRSRHETLYKGKVHTIITEDQILSGLRYDSLCWFIVGLYVAEGQCMKAYEFIKEVNPTSYDPEVDLYKLLSYYVPSGKDWLKIYNEAVKNGIKPRKELQGKAQKMG